MWHKKQNWLSSNLKVRSLIPGCPWERHWFPNCSCCIHWCVSVSVWKWESAAWMSVWTGERGLYEKALWMFSIAKQQVSASPFIILMVVSFIHICVRLSHNKLVFHGVLALWSLKSWPVTWNQTSKACTFGSRGLLLLTLTSLFNNPGYV